MTYISPPSDHHQEYPSDRHPEYREALSPRGGTQLKVRIRSKLGRGAFAVVHKAGIKERSEKNYREGYVLKTPPGPYNPYSRNQNETYRSLRNEKSMRDRLGEHPNVITYEATTPKGSIVMERLNKTLPDRLKEIRSARDLSFRTHYTMQANRDIIKALLHVKENHLSHNDTHHGNWLTDNSNRVKLIDFGVASFDSGEGLADAKSYQATFGRNNDTQHCFFITHPFTIILQNFITTKTHKTATMDKMLQKLYPVLIHDLHDYIMNKPDRPSARAQARSSTVTEHFFAENARIFAEKSEACGIAFQRLLNDLLAYHNGPRLQEGQTVQALQNILSDPELFPQPLKRSHSV